MALRYAARRDENESRLVQVAQALGAVWIQAPPFDGWLYFRGTWYLVEIKQPQREGRKHEYTDAQKLTILRLNERQVPWYTLRTDDDVYRLLGARRTA